jgi:hypothetical protein
MNWINNDHDEHAGSWPRRMMWFGVAAAVFLLGGAALLWWSWQSQLSRRLAEIRARGEPTNLTELDAYYPYPPVAADATQLWTLAGERLETGVSKATVLQKKLPFLGEGSDPPPPGQPWAELELSRQFLADNAPAMQALRDAAALGGRARYIGPIDANWITLLLPHIQSLRSCARALKLEANVRAHEGTAHGAAETLHVGLALARSLEQEPVWVSQLVHAAIFGMMVNEFKRQLPLVHFADEDLQMIAADLAQFDFAASAKRAMIGERAGGLSTFANPRSMGLNRWQALYSQTVRGADQALFLEIMSDYVESTTLPWPQMLARTDELASQLRGRITRMHPMTSILLPALSAATNALARCEVERRLMIVTIAIERYRQRMGRPPDELAALVPEYLSELPTDPTTGDPFQYATFEAGFVIYSPSQRFPMQGLRADPETDANPELLFRDPPLPEEPPAEDVPATENTEEAAGEAASPNGDLPPGDSGPSAENDAPANANEA